MRAFWRSLVALFMASDAVVQEEALVGVQGAESEGVPCPGLPDEPFRPEALKSAKTSSRAFLVLLRETPSGTAAVILLSLIWAGLNTAAPVLLFRFLQDLGSAKPDNAAMLATCYALAFFALALAVGFLSTVVEWFKFHYHQMVSIRLAKALFGHALTLDGAQLQGLDPGFLLSRLSMDTKTLALYQGEVSLVTFNLACFVIGNLFLYRILGLVGLVSVALLVLPFPLLRRLSSGFYRHEMGSARHRDTRIGLLAHALGQIRTIKAMGMEATVQDEIAEPRRRELAERRNYVGNLARFLFTTTFLNAVVIVVTFALHLAQGHPLTPAVAFSTMAMLRVIRRVVETIPLCVGGLSQRLMALQRIREVLAMKSRNHV